MCIYNMYKCTYVYVYYMILLYLEGSGSKFHSVNTKTGQIFFIFWIPGVEKKHVNTKTMVNFRVSNNLPDLYGVDI